MQADVILKEPTPPLGAPPLAPLVRPCRSIPLKLEQVIRKKERKLLF